MENRFPPQPGILDIDLYVGGASTVAGVENPIKLSSNENPFGPSRRALDAFRQSAGQLERYPSSDHAALRAAIAKVHDLDADRIICGAGSDEVIAFLCQAYAGPGDEVLYTEHGFSMYRISALAAGATPVVARETNRTTDVDALLECCTENTRLVFVANPNNPTGTMISQDEVARLADGLPPRALLVLDGAYAEYVEGFDAGVALIEACENIVMTRTFSKIYGLGGLRIGWGYGPREVIDVLNRLRGPFNVSGPALATAEAAVRDQAYIARCRAENAKWREWLQAELNRIGLPNDDAHGNFVLPKFANEAQAAACDAFLKSHGLIVRRVAGYKLPEFLRITVGDEPTCRKLIALMQEFMQGAKR